jgi:hypothetical protein
VLTQKPAMHKKAPIDHRILRFASVISMRMLFLILIILSYA